MFTRAEKEAIIDGLKQNIDKAQAIFLTNLVGLQSNDAVRIRKSVRDANGKLVITRNSLFERAAKGTKCEPIFKNLKGPHAVAFAYGDAAAVAKCLKEAGEEFEEFAKLKAGLLNEQVLNAAELMQLSNLPSRNQMLGTLLATFMAPVSSLARVLNTIREEKEKGTLTVK
ncbi:MAG: 50S ribosomal protein L10 [Bdellovibrio sp.]|nr:50S ribosomal protein L10 [Bdellovibrio sp.]